MMSNKTSKEIYKDLAKQWGITCKMSESCRCMECQSHYFDCDYDDVSNAKDVNPRRSLTNSIFRMSIRRRMADWALERPCSSAR